TLRDHLSGNPADDLPKDIREQVAEFREEASSPVRQLLLTAIADAAVSVKAVAALETIGRELFLSADQIASATDGQLPPSAE
ncbi:MAG: hypothetical protein P8I25_08125, partial [Ilumatobacter sp.]|nr:hypothetical protein [Ilumatobacter sp.]